MATENHPTIEQIRTAVERDLHFLGEEVEKVRLTLVLPEWEGALHGYPRTLYGYVMNCFSYIDLLSRLWRGRPDQTRRMIAFMNRFFEIEPRINRVAIQMWRHGLMHTGNPQPIQDPSSGNRYTWLLHWGEEHLPPEENLSLQKGPGENEYTLKMGLVALVSHLKHATWSFFNEVQTDLALTEQAIDEWVATRVERARVEP